MFKNAWHRLHLWWNDDVKSRNFHTIKYSLDYEPAMRTFFFCISVMVFDQFQLEIFSLWQTILFNVDAEKFDDLIIIQWPNVLKLGSVSVSLLSIAVHLCVQLNLLQIEWSWLHEISRRHTFWHFNPNLNYERKHFIKVLPFQNSANIYIISTFPIFFVNIEN